MKSQIVFFDNIQNSIRGTTRGFIVLIFFLIFSSIWYLLLMRKIYSNHIDNTNLSNKIIGLIFISLFIISAIGVHNPNTPKKALFYAGLVGLVVYGCWNSVLLITLDKWNIKIFLIDTIWGILSTSLLGLILYYFMIKYKWLKPV